nr:immunoglobulin heavy chain junction region [Mus musculus]
CTTYDYDRAFAYW